MSAIEGSPATPLSDAGMAAAGPAPGEASDAFDDPAEADESRARSSAVGAVPAAPVLRHLGHAPYEPTWRAMQRFTDARTAETPDEIWFVEHPPVFTLGMNASRAHLIAPGDIPVVQTDRGGQVTYHGPGQLVVYPLIDLRRRRLGLREMVVALENAVIDYVGARGVTARGRRDAPGVYVGESKLASIGLRIRRGASYHGMALNVCLDPEPFERINPCGYAGLRVVRLADLVPGLDGEAAVGRVAHQLTPYLLRALGGAVGAQSAISTDLQAVSSR